MKSKKRVGEVKKLFAFILAFALVIGFVPKAAYAHDGQVNDRTKELVMANIGSEDLSEEGEDIYLAGEEEKLDKVEKATKLGSEEESLVGGNESQLTNLTGGSRANINIDNTNFPDPVFRKYIEEKIDTDENKILSPTEIAGVTVIDFGYKKSVPDEKRAKNLIGIEHFTNLEKLDCSWNNITDLNPISQNTKLTELRFKVNKVTSLDISNKKDLKVLDCSGNPIDNFNIEENILLEELYCARIGINELDVTRHSKLRVLDFSNNKLTHIDLSNNASLEVLKCSFNYDLAEIDVHHILGLKILECGRNNLKTLDVSQNIALKELVCYTNMLTELNVQNNEDLEVLECGFNENLMSLDVTKNEKLKELSVERIGLKDIDVSKNVNLEYFDCFGNKLETLNLKDNPRLLKLVCSANKLTSLDLTGNPALTNLNTWANKELETIDISNNDKLIAIDCHENKLTSLDVTGKKNLRTLYCSGNKLTSVDVTQNKNLEQLSCNNNLLTEIDVDQNEKMYYLNLSGNKLESLNLENNRALKRLYCDSTTIKSLDLQNNELLEELKCFDNQLTKLDVSKNTNLNTLVCSRNQLTKLDVSKNTKLTRLECNSNQLTNLVVGQNANLFSIKCFDNKLTDLDVSKNTKLTNLECNSNQLTDLDVSKNTKLTNLECNSNQLTSLDVSKNTNLTRLECHNNKLVVEPDKVENGIATYSLGNLLGLDVSRVKNLENLVNNEIKFSTEGKPEQVELSYKYDTKGSGHDGDYRDFKLVIKLTIADRITPVVPDEKVKVDDKTNLTDDEKEAVKEKLKEANKDNFPAETKVEIGNDGSATITYPDKSTDSILGDKLVVEKTQADKITPVVPDEKVKVDDKTNLTEAEKEAVKDNVENANQGNFPSGTKVEIGNDGSATIIYPDKSTDSISGDKLVKEDTPDKTIDRISGENRYETAIEVSKKNFSKADTVIIARADTYPDALSAAVLSKVKKAPILLTQSDKLLDIVRNEIKRLGAKNIIIVGGDRAVSKDVEKSLDKYGVERISGKDRFETSAMIARKLAKENNIRGRAVIASGEVWADALAVGSFAGKEGYPILLVNKDSIPEVVEKTIKDLGIKEVYVAGGSARISEKAKGQLPKIVKEFAGKDRYETASLIAKFAFKNSKKAYLVSGESFADALIIGGRAAIDNAPILLTEQETLASASKKFLEESNIKDITIIGGSARISKAIETMLK